MNNKRNGLLADARHFGRRQCMGKSMEGAGRMSDNTCGSCLSWKDGYCDVYGFYISEDEPICALEIETREAQP